MKRYKTGILSAILPTVILVLTLALNSCVKESLPGGGEFGEGEATVTLELVPPGAYSTPQTRATDQEQNDIHKAMVFVFKNDKVVQWIPVPTITDKKMTVNGIKTSQNESDKFDIVVVANHPLDVAEGHDFMDKTREYLSDFFRVSSTTASINDLRMWGETRGVYVHPVSNSFQIQMLRSLARIDIGFGQYDPTHPIYPWPGAPLLLEPKVHIIGTTNSSTAMPLPQNVGPDGSVIAPTIPSDATSDGHHFYEIPYYLNAIESEIFVPEAVNSKDDPIKIIIEGCPSMDLIRYYYRIDICRPDPTTGTDTYLNILRNHLYRISITKISGPGYTTLEEAMSAPPLNNIAVDITAIDEGGSGIVIFDGNSSITADVKEATIYGKPNGTTLYPIVTVKAIIGNGVTTAQVTGTGIATPIKLENNTPKLIEVAPPVGTTANVKLTITVGRLKHDVYFTVQPPVDAHFDFLPFQNVASMTVEKPQSWITLSQNRTYVKSEQQPKYIIGDANGKAVAHFDENISTTDAPRMASVLLQRMGKSTKTRVVFEQLNLNGMVMGLFGGVKDNGGYTKQLAVESVEEYAERFYDASVKPEVNAFQWGFNDVYTDVRDVEFGRLSTITLAKTKFTNNGLVTNETDLSIYNNYPARYCYDKNRDTNGNGKIDDAEVVWYLPAQNQLMGLWIAHARIITPFAANDYWSATEYQDNMSWYVNFDTFIYTCFAWRHNKIDARKVRCVREL